MARARRDTRTRTDAAPQPRSLVAAAAPVDITSRAAVDRIAKHHQTWQDEAWAYFTAIGEIGDTLTYRANVISKVDLYAGILPEEGDDEPIPVSAAVDRGEDDEGRKLPPLLTDAQAQVIDDTMARLDRGSGLPQLLHKMSLNLDVPGEVHVIGEETEQGEEWHAWSDGELEAKGGKVRIRESPDDKRGRLVDPESVIFRVWRPHPRWTSMAHTFMRPIVEEGTAEEMLLIGRESRAGAKSRIGKGAVAIANDLDFAAPDDGHAGAELDSANGRPSVQESIVDAMVTPVGSEGTAAEVAPIVITASSQQIAEGGVWTRLDLGQVRDPLAYQRATQLLDRIAGALPMPKEVTLGMGNINHWGSWQIERVGFRVYIEPTVLAICHAFTIGFLRPLLLAEGLPEDLVGRIVVWYDPSDALAPEDRDELTLKAVAEGLIGPRAARRELRFDESDAPSEDEVLERLFIIRSIMTADLSTVVGKLAGLLPPSVSLAGPSDNGSAPIDTPSTETPPAEGPPPDDQPMTAAAGPDLGARLAAIDARLVDRLLTAADLAVERAIERANNRIRSLANKDPKARAVLAKIPTADAATTLGDTWSRTIAAQAGGEGDPIEAIIVPTFATLAERFDRWAAQAQTDTLAVVESVGDLSNGERAQAALEYEGDRADAARLLIAALTVLAVGRLFDRSPDATPGEVDATVAVPMALIREAVAVAGGALNVERNPLGGLSIDGRAVGGIGTGERARTLFASVQAPWTGYRWVYGDASARTNPFEPHMRLDGLTFARWEDQALANRDTSWLPTTTYSPGDHRGCLCSWTPILLAPAQEEAA